MLTPEDTKMLHDGAVKGLRKNWNAPTLHVELHEQKTTKPWPAEAQAVAQQIKDSPRGWLYALVGNRGGGKTQLAVGLMFDYTDRERSAYYMTALSFFMRIKATMRQGSNEDALDVIGKLRAKRLLIIEEVSRRGETEWENNLLFELINARYNDRTDTLLIDNSTVAEFSARMDPSIISRMNEKGGIITADWPSYR